MNRIPLMIGRCVVVGAFATGCYSVHHGNPPPPAKPVPVSQPRGGGVKHRPAKPQPAPRPAKPQPAPRPAAQNHQPTRVGNPQPTHAGKPNADIRSQPGPGNRQQMGNRQQNARPAANKGNKNKPNANKTPGNKGKASKAKQPVRRPSNSAPNHVQ